MDGAGCFFEGRHQRAVKPQWGDSVTCVRIAEEGMFLLRGNKLKCCFPGDSSDRESDINQSLGCKSYRVCKLIMVLYLFLNRLRQFLSRASWLTQQMSGNQGGMSGRRAEQQGVERGQALPVSAQRVVLVPSQSPLDHQHFVQPAQYFLVKRCF